MNRESVFTALFLVALLACASPMSRAQTTTAGSYYQMQRAIGGIMKDATASRGYVATDPRTYTTLQSVGTVAAGAAAAVGTGLLVAGTSPGWASLMAVYAGGAVISFGVNYGLNWLLGTGNTPITRTDATNPALPYYNAQPTGAGYWLSYYPQVYASDPYTAMFGAAQISQGVNGPFTIGSPCVYPPNFDPKASGQMMPCNLMYNGTAYNYQPVWYPNGAPFALAPGVAYRPNGTPLPAATISQPGAESLATAISNMTTQLKEDRVNYQQMANMLNALWKKAYADNPSTTVPYDPNNPIKPEKVKEWADKNPDKYPKVKDTIAPIPTGTPGWTPDLDTSSDTPVSPSPTIPTDYARDASVQAIKTAVDGHDVPDGSSIDKDVDINKVDSKNIDATAVVTGITADSVGLFDWFPHIPTTACSNPVVPDTFGGSHEVPICGPVNLFSKIVSAVLCVFAMIGSIREVQSALRS